MAAEENLRASNIKHKLFVGFLKVLPMVMAGLYLLNTILSYYDIDISFFSYLTGVGFIPWLFIIGSSYLFKFCSYHRMFLWYVLTNNVICWTDSTFRLPITDWELFLLHIVLAGVSMFIVLWLRFFMCKRQ